MKAIVYTRYGPPEVLAVTQIEKPLPARDEVLIKVRAVEATKSDCEMRSFKFPVKWFWLPLRLGFGLTGPRRNVLGGYFAGEIEAVGGAVTRFKPGDAIFGAAKLRFGAYAEYVCLPADYTLAPKPTTMSFVEAAAVPLGGLNALHFLRRACITPGEQVLINGAGASIGTFAVQIAKLMGAEVTAVDSAIKEPMLRQIGADHFIDYARQDFTQDAQRYDVIFNVVAGRPYFACVKSLKPGGRYLLANPRLSDMLLSVFTSRFTDKKVIVALAGELEEELLSLKHMIEAGQIRSAVDEVYSFEQVAQAHRRVEMEQRLGCVVLVPD